MAPISMAEVEKHNQPSDCWVVLHGQVYDLTEFHASHPGGSAIITDYAGMVSDTLMAQFVLDDHVRCLVLTSLIWV